MLIRLLILDNDATLCNNKVLLSIVVKLILRSSEVVELILTSGKVMRY